MERERWVRGEWRDGDGGMLRVGSKGEERTENNGEGKGRQPVMEGGGRERWEGDYGGRGGRSGVGEGRGK